MALLPILHEIIAEGKKQHLNQKDIAHRANVNEVTFSRMLRGGNAQWTNVEALANAVGMKLIVVKDDKLVEGLTKGNLF